jgi:hypothetical protein
VGRVRGWLIVLAALMVGLVAGLAAGAFLGRSQLSGGPVVPTPSPTPSVVSTPTAPAVSCVLWSPQGDFNVTITGDHTDHDWPGYCALAKQKLAMHEAGPAAGVVTCDMTDQGISLVFRDTASRTYFPCDRAAAFFGGIRANY